MRSFLVATTTLLALIDFLSCSPELLEFADWTIPVPEGTLIIEYAAVPMEERTERIELVEDLVIGPRGDDTNYTFYRPRGLTVDGEGRIYVLDTGNHRIQVFNEEGRYLRTIGHEGEGPGEFQSPGSIAATGNRLLVTDMWDARLRAWSLEGELLQEKETSAPESLSLLQGLEDGSFVATYPIIERWTTEDGRGHSSGRALVPARVSPDGDVTNAFVELPTSVPVFQRGGMIAVPQVPFSQPLVAASSTGNVYAARGDEYQILAFADSGEPRWALRVSGLTQLLPEAHIDAALADLRSHNDLIERSDINWPERLPAVSKLHVDGRGHLYVFPFLYVPWEGEPEEEVPVDVYAPDGERLFAGTMLAHHWSAALGELVYCLETDSRTEEQIVVR